MGIDALKDLRAWQREQAGAQDKALRSARRARQVLDVLDSRRAVAVDAVGGAVTELEATGLTREQCAALLDLGPDELNRIVVRRRPARSGTGPVAAREVTR